MVEGEFAATIASHQLRAKEALERSPVLTIRGLQVEENEHEIIVSGLVSSYYLKQLAQEALMPILGRRRLCNRVEVRRL